MTCDMERVREVFPDRRIDYYDTLDSTMRAATGLDLDAVVVAGEQTAGQGRHGHSWHSEPGNGLYVSIVLPPAPVLTLALGLATVEAIAQVCGVACDLRWPNDVMIGSRKIAGILVQLVDGRAIAGIGINVNHTDFPPELAQEATSLRLASGGSVECTALLIGLLRAIDTFVREDKETILRLFTQASSYAAGRRVTVALPGGDIEGTTAGLDVDGFLIVRKDDGTEALILAGGVRAAGS
jgi:BirA family transcriptional regulator, biotin operon repressor / biotin---[acetyl-CoA-carboxylase] ligase